MRNDFVRSIVVAFAIQVAVAVAPCVAQTEADTVRYPAMAPLGQYLMSDRNSEIELARSAAPKSVSDKAEVMVLGPEGYTTAVKGTNGFLCIVERSWGAATDDAEFWNPNIRAPICFNASSRNRVVSIYLLKTKLVLAGKSRGEISQAVASALDKKEVPGLEPGAMCYMMSKQQYLNDEGKNWHPHLMFFVEGDGASSWGANLPGSPVIATNDSQERMTIFMIWAAQWSDGSPGPMMDH
ncbi:MAG: hypothetical protein WBZ48_01760 [Bacteroidota bacterium]